MRALAWLLVMCSASLLACSKDGSCVAGTEGCQRADAGSSSGGTLAGGGGNPAVDAGAGAGGGLDAGAAGEVGAESPAGAGGAAAGAGGDVGDGAGAGAGGCETAPVAVGTIESDELTEISGIATSLANPGVYYVHNDSGDAARFFAIDEQGRTLGEFVLSGATAVDWEDIALGPGPSGGSYVYLGDTGDGGGARTQVEVYRVPEPALTLGQTAATVDLSDWERLPLAYPTAAHDCEALLLDPKSSDLLLVTKENDGNSSVFRASALAPADQGQTLELVTQLAFGTQQAPGSTLVTGGEISALGDGILLRTYSSVFFWPRAMDVELAAAFSTSPQALSAPTEEQGEAITFSADGSAFLTVSEGEHPQIFRALQACER